MGLPHGPKIVNCNYEAEHSLIRVINDIDKTAYNRYHSAGKDDIGVSERKASENVMVVYFKAVPH